MLNGIAVTVTVRGKPGHEIELNLKTPEGKNKVLAAALANAEPTPDMLNLVLACFEIEELGEALSEATEILKQAAIIKLLAPGAEDEAVMALEREYRGWDMSPQAAVFLAHAGIQSVKLMEMDRIELRAIPGINERLADDIEAAVVNHRSAPVA